MTSERTVIEVNTVGDTPDQNDGSVQDSVVYRSGERASPTREKPKYKNIPEDWKAIPSGRFRKVITDIEAVLLEISVDGRVTSNPFNWRPTIPTLQGWADHLRSALKELTK